MSRPSWSLAARLSVWYAATAFLLVVVAALVQYRSLVMSLSSEDDLDLVERLESELQAPRQEKVRTNDERQGRIQVRVLDPTCQPSGFATTRYPPVACDSLEAAEPRFYNWRAPDGTRWRVVRARQIAPAGGWIEVLLDRSNDERVVRSYREELLTVLVVALLASMMLGYVIARRGLLPLSRLARRIHQIDARSLERRLAPPGAHRRQPAEVEALVAAFDEMLGRLEHAFRTLTEFSADLAHELRTPIHVLRQQAEIALHRARTPDQYREVLGSSLEELDRMRRMVDDMLFLARAEDPRSVVNPVPLRLAQEIDDVTEFLSAEAGERGVSVVATVSRDIELLADRNLFRRGLVNVIVNALRHTPAGGRVSITSRKTDGGVTIDISDTGEGISAELLSHVFDRYVRTSATRPLQPMSAGLGLTIVQGIMRLHGGIATASSLPGSGTVITLTFPTQPQPTRGDVVSDPGAR